MDRKGLTDAEVLAALYNRAQPQGMGFMHYDPKPMTVEDAETFLKKGDDLHRLHGARNGGNYFDYLKGRVMKIDVSENPLDTRLYNRDNGKNAAEDSILDVLTDPRRQVKPSR